MGEEGFEVEVESSIEVTLPSGSTFQVLTESEKRYVEERARRYMDDNHFVNISDLQDVDRMIQMELFINRWSLYVSKGFNYFGDEIDEKQLSRQIGEYSTELRQLKRILGIDKVSRDRTKGDDSVVAFMDQLRVRAREFGIMRDKQTAKAIELFQQLSSLVIFHDNADEIERQENAVTQDDIMDWIRTIAMPEFKAIDEHFRNTNQKTWIRKQ